MASLAPPNTHGMLTRPYSSALVASGVTPPLTFRVVDPTPPAFLNSFVAYYGVAGSLGNLPVEIVVPPVANGSVLGIAWVTADKGAGPSGVTDAFNDWSQMPGGYFSNSGYSTLFVCPALTPGTYEITVGGLVGGTPPSQAPVVTVLLFSLPLDAGVQALQTALACNGINGTWYQGSVLTLDSFFGASDGSWHSTLVAFINTTPADLSGISRTWAIGAVPAGAVASGICSTYEDTGTLETGASGFCTIASPAIHNFVTFAPSPTPPPPAPFPGPNNQLWTAVVGLIISTKG